MSGTIRPMNLDAFERYPLLFGPSPVHRLERLTRHLGGATLWAKRDDCNSGLAYGGNKTRKLEYLVADALAQDCDTLVSIGDSICSHDHDCTTSDRRHPRIGRWRSRRRTAPHHPRAERADRATLRA